MYPSSISKLYACRSYLLPIYFDLHTVICWLGGAKQCSSLYRSTASRRVVWWDSEDSDYRGLMNKHGQSQGTPASQNWENFWILQIFGGLVFGCIKTKFWKKICVRQHFSSSTRFASFCTAAISKFSQKAGLKKQQFSWNFSKKIANVAKSAKFCQISKISAR